MEEYGIQEAMKKEKQKEAYQELLEGWKNKTKTKTKTKPKNKFEEYLQQIQK